MLRINRVANGEVIFTLSGRMNEENLGELKSVINSEANSRRIMLDLKDLTIVDREAVKFLDRCESDSIEVKNCPVYIRSWINRLKDTK